MSNRKVKILKWRYSSTTDNVYNDASANTMTIVFLRYGYVLSRTFLKENATLIFGEWICVAVEPVEYDGQDNFFGRFWKQLFKF